ncbi:MAG: hypothetical protein FJ104_01255 [Deltaproteobacteria bacterium]|nr:hypothetical protein [Deltaproteobacteria bacterium]
MARSLAVARLLPFAAALLVAAVPLRVAQAAPATNTVCPVTSEPIEPEFATIY